MDPDANLLETLRLVNRILEATDACDLDNEDPVYNPRDVLRLAELVEALDGWMSKGNFLPAKWSAKR